MKKRYTEEQIVQALQRVGQGTTIQELRRDREVSDVRRLRVLEDEKNRPTRPQAGARVAQSEAAVTANRQAPAPVLPEVASEAAVAAMAVQAEETWLSSRTNGS